MTSVEVMEEVVALKHYGIGKAVNETLVTYVALVEAAAAAKAK